MIQKIKNTNKGMIIVQTIVFAAIAMMIISALSSAMATTINAGRITYIREQAFQS